MERISVKSSVSDSGFSVDVNGRKYTNTFPKGSWDNFPKKQKNILSSSHALLSTMHLPLLWDSKKISYNFARPFVEPFFSKLMLKGIPLNSEMDKVSSFEYLKKYNNTDYEFEDNDNCFEPLCYDAKENAVINFTFGKESLLTLGLAKELEIKPSLVFNLEPDGPIENEYKKNISKRFSDRFGVDFGFIENQTALLRNYPHLGLSKKNFWYPSITSDYLLGAVPLAAKTGSSYLFFGSEKSCDDSYINSDGLRTYPAYYQTTEWISVMDSLTKVWTENKLSVSSMLDSINELAGMKVLHQRYPDIAKYQMSCFPDENTNSKKSIYCENCSKCARVYIFLKAIGADPKSVGFTSDMLKKEYAPLYAIFKSEKSLAPFDNSGVGKDEQKFAFYLAYKKGVKGELVEKFKKEFLDETMQREDELIKTFFGIYQAKTLPEKLKAPIKKIYKEELRNVF